jgi:hypothetical protein
MGLLDEESGHMVLKKLPPKHAGEFDSSASLQCHRLTIVSFPSLLSLLSHDHYHVEHFFLQYSSLSCHLIHSISCNKDAQNRRDSTEKESIMNKPVVRNRWTGVLPISRKRKGGSEGGVLLSGEWFSKYVSK